MSSAPAHRVSELPAPCLRRIMHSQLEELPFGEPFDEDQIPVHMVAGPQALNGTANHEAIVFKSEGQGQTEVLLHIQEDNAQGHNEIYAQFEGETNEAHPSEDKNYEVGTYEGQNDAVEPDEGQNDAVEPDEGQNYAVEPDEGQNNVADKDEAGGQINEEHYEDNKTSNKVEQYEGETNELEQYEGEGQIEALEDFESQDGTEPDESQIEKLDEFEGNETYPEGQVEYGDERQNDTEPEEEHLDEQMQEDEGQGQTEAAGENEEVEWLMEDALTDEDSQSQPELDETADTTETEAKPDDTVDTGAADKQTVDTLSRTDLPQEQEEERVTSTEDLLRMLGEDTVKKTSQDVDKPESRAVEAKDMKDETMDSVRTGGDGSQDTALSQSADISQDADMSQDADISQDADMSQDADLSHESDGEEWESQYIQEAKAKLATPMKTYGRKVVQQQNGNHKENTKKPTQIAKKPKRSSIVNTSLTTRAKSRQDLAKDTKIIKGTKGKKDAKVTKATKEAKVTNTTKDAKVTKATKDAKVTKATKDAKVTKATKDAKVIKDTKETKVSKVTKDAKATKEANDAKVTKDAKDAKVTKDAKDAKVTKDAKDAKVTKDTMDAKSAKDTKSKVVKTKKDVVVKWNTPKTMSVSQIKKRVSELKTPTTDEDSEDLDDFDDFLDDESSDIDTDELEVMLRGGIKAKLTANASAKDKASGPAAKRRKVLLEEDMTEEESDFSDDLDDLSSDEEPPEHRFPVDLRDERASEFLPLLGSEATKLLTGERNRLARAIEELQKKHKEVQAEQRQSGEQEQALRRRLEHAKELLAA